MEQGCFVFLSLDASLGVLDGILSLGFVVFGRLAMRFNQLFVSYDTNGASFAFHSIMAGWICQPRQVRIQGFVG